ncbi:MAG: APC family permease [Thaumarchaeota archaeon]|nr:APC family permease [Nitrososphaerota archaeon]
MDKDSKVFAREATGLVRGISPFGAFVAGILAMSPPVVIYEFWSLTPAIFPNSNTLLIVALVFVPVIFWALMYLQFNVAMPRSGGDYVWVSRTLHPAVGFMANFYIFFWQTTVLGALAFLTTLFMGAFLQITGIEFNSPSTFALAATLSKPINTTIVGSILLIVFALIIVSGVRNTVITEIVLWAVSIAGVFAFVAVLLATSNGTFISNFNQVMGPSASSDAIMKIAANAGWTSGWTFRASVGAMAFGILTIASFNWSMYTGGEMKSVKRSSWASSIIPVIFGASLFELLGYAIYNTMGYNFVQATGLLYSTNPGAVPVGTGAAAVPLGLPWVYTIFMNGNPYLDSFIALAMVLGLAGVLLPVFMLVTRTLFAYSFDRILPTRFASVSDRFHTPVFSIVFILVIAIIVTAISNLTFFYGTYLTNTTLGFILATIVVAAAAIKFPYGKTKSLFENAPSITKVKVAGVPLITISGIVTLVSFLYVAYEGFTTPAIGGVISPYSFIGGLIIPFAVPWVIYYASKSYHKSHGVDIDLAFKEIPPE